MDLAKILSLTIVMVAGPQILSAIFLATTEDWRKNSLAFIVGAACSITIVTSAAYLLVHGAARQGASHTTLDIIILLLLVAAAVRTFLKRKESKPPKWMGKLENAKPGQSFKLGFLLLGVFPTDILTSVAVGSYVSNQGESWLRILPFVLLTLFWLALPMLLLLAFGKRAQAFLPKARDWMNSNSWVVNEIVLALFILLTLGNLG